jgi:putative hydrolase of the HAD superfamily
VGEDGGMTERGLLLDLGGTAFGSGLERLALLGEREPAVRSVAARRGPIGSEPDLLWDAMLRGEITEREYWKARSAEVGAALGQPDWPITAFMHLLYGLVEDVMRPEAVALVADAKAAGMRVGALTNDLAAFHGDAGMAGDPFLAGLDALVDGSVTGVLKPDPRAYALAATALGLPPSAIVFVDDMPWNATAATDAGMIGLLLDLADPAAVFERARKELGL